MSKKYFSLFLALFIVFMSCKHDKVKMEEEYDNNEELQQLNLEKITINGELVKNGKITLSQEQITAEDIEAHFSYGKVTDAVIGVVVKDSPFILDKAKPKTLHLSVPDEKNKYKGCTIEIEVSWKEKKEDTKELITSAGIEGCSENGVYFTATEEQLSALFNNLITLKLKGPNAFILLGSRNFTWTKCVIDGQELPFKPYPKYSFKSSIYTALKLSDQGSTKEHHILVESGNKKQEVSFKIKRLEGTVDIPKLKLFIVGRDEITEQNFPKLFDGSRPSFKGTDPCHIEVRCENNDVESCTIDGSTPINMAKKTVDGNEVYFAEHSVTGVKPSGKDVDITIKPKNTSDYHVTTWKFHLDYQEKTHMNVVYTFNNIPRHKLSKQFKDDLEGGKKPTLNLTNASFLNMQFKSSNAKLSEVKVNGTSYTGTALLEKGIGTIFNHSLPITSTEQEIKVVLVPKDTGKHDEAVFEFKVMGDGNKESLKPSLSINETTKFSNEFMAKLIDGTNPLHKVFNSPANIEIAVDEYTYTFLTNSIKINGEEIRIKEEKKGLKALYLAKKAIDVTTSEAKNVEIEFVAKTPNIFTPLIWKFQVQGGAEKPVFPKDKVALFTINELGGYGKDPLPKELIDHLTDGNPYTYVIDANQAIVEVGWYEDTDKMLEHTIFEVDEVSTTVTSQKKGNACVCSHIVPLPNQTEHTIKIKMVPKANTIYKELEYSFKIKNSGLLPKLPLKFWVELSESISDGEEKIVKTDMPIVSVTSEEKDNEEIMEEVKINGTKVDIEKKDDSTGEGFFFEAMKAIDISTTNYTNITISVTPKNTTKYRPSTCTFKLKAEAAMPKDNGKFEFNGEVAKAEYNVEWVDAEKRASPNDHGAKSVIITLHTESPHAKVRYKKLFSAEDKDVNVAFEQELSTYEEARHIGNMHITKKIELEQNIPITIKAEVIPDEGTTDQSKGIHYITFNPVTILWNYSEGTKHTEYANAINALEEVSGVKVPVIKVKKDEVQEGKIYLTLGTWDEEYGCNVATTETVKFTKLDVEGYFQWYKTTIDVSSLNTPTDEVDVSFPLLFNGKPSFTYNFKIKLE